MAVNYEDVLTDLESKKASLENAINTLRQLTGRSPYPNPFANGTTAKSSSGSVSGKTVTTFGFGRNKGVPTDVMALDDLRYYESWLEKTLADPSKRSNRINAKSDEEKLAVVKAELAKRGAQS